MNLDSLTAYRLVKEVERYPFNGYLFRHIKTGARVMAIENDDEKQSLQHCIPHPRPKTAP